MAPLDYTLTTARPPGSGTKPVDWRYTGSSLRQAPVAAAMARIGTVADGKPQPVPDDQVLGGGFPVFQMSMATWMLLSGRPLLVSKTPGTHG
jgi:hypothetical protein